MNQAIYTIGHSNHTSAHFIDLLRQHEITALCDVRSRPYSSFNPHFDREALKASLESSGIAYVFLGKELGARSDDPACYLYGKVQFQQLAKTTLFQQGLNRVEDGAKSFRLALMCAEKEPLDCHRAILVARRLVERGLEVKHIHADGRLEGHGDAMIRLAQAFHLRESELHLFRTPKDLLSDTYSLQEQRISYETETAQEIRNMKSRTG